MKETGCLFKTYIIIACLFLGSFSLLLVFTQERSLGTILSPLLISIASFGILYYIIYSSIVNPYRYQAYCKANNIDYSEQAPNIFIGSNSLLLSKKNDIGSDIYNYMSGKKNGYDFVIADYAYVYSFSGTTPNTCHNTFFVLSYPNIQMPKFYICPRINSDKLDYIKDFQYNVIDLSETNKDFSENFIIASDNADAVKEFFTYEICQRFVEFQHANCYFEGRDNRLFFLVYEELNLENNMKLIEICENLFDYICGI